MSLSVLLLSVAVMAGLAGASNNVAPPLPPLNTFLTCNVKFQLSTGAFFAIPRQPPVIPFQPGVPGQIWFPVPSGWDAPIGKFSQSAAFTHLGNDFNSALTSTTLPGGRDVRLQDIPGYSEPQRILPGIPPTDPADVNTVLDYFENNNYGDFSCELEGEWTDLGRNYFPRYLLATYCASGNCSFAAESGCHPDLTTGRDTSPFYVSMLRWDCCQNFVGEAQQYQHECGWIKVQVPIIRTCFCGCAPALDQIDRGSEK